MASSSSPSSLWKFDVFLSFRGVDTRKTFVSFLYKELDRKGIKIFKDDQELERGEYISHALLLAIEESKFAIVVMSENYASSGWCLEELAKITECHEKGMLTAMPVFYEVEPSHVRRQTGKFAEQMKKHERRENREKVQRWRDALRKLANISGESSVDWNDDSKLVDKIAKDISNRLSYATPSDFSGLVGIDVRMEAMYTLLDLESKDESRKIGIWGMGGAGKTALAIYVYEEIARHFQSYCFLENVKKIYGAGGAKRLQEELLSQSLGEGLTIRSSFHGYNVIKARLGHRKVLIVMDDVDDIEQLEAISKEPNLFGPGSRVIVTTRDKHLLDAHGVEHVYEVKCLKYNEALQLFCQHTFAQKYLLSGFEHLSAHAVKLAGGLPLALKVFARSLVGEDKDHWEFILNRLKRSPNKVMEILKISYDSLDEECKSIFLRIACFFRGKHVDDVARLVDDDARRASLGIKMLVKKSLIVKWSHGCITMHDLVQQMGKELAGQQSSDGPRKQLILSEPHEICDILTNESGTSAIDGITLDAAEVDELIVNPKALEKMPNLKFFEIYTSRYDNETNVFLKSDLFLAAELRYLRWDEYPSKTIQIRAERLVELDLRNSKLEKLWEGSPCLANLKKVDISYSFNLTEFPNLSKAPNLEVILAQRCESLNEIPSSVGNLNRLTWFNLWRCCRLERLPNNMDMESLETVEISGCSSLKIFPQFSRGIKGISISNGKERGLPESIGYLSHLVRLEVSHFKWLEDLPRTIGGLTSLKYLYFDDCPRLWRIPETIGNLIVLEQLAIRVCHRLWRIPETIGNLIALKELNIIDCPRLLRIPKTIQKLKTLKLLEVSNCWSITEFPHLPNNVKRVTFIGTAIEEIPSWIEDSWCLVHLNISRNKRLNHLSTSLYNLKHLKSLFLEDSSSLQCFQAQIYETKRPFGEPSLAQMSIRAPSFSNFVNLICLRISRADKSNVVAFHCPPLSNFPYLRYLYLVNLNMLEIPDDLGDLSNLQSLDLSGNDFEKIPTSIGRLCNLDKLQIDNCKNIRSLPKLPFGIRYLSAHGCVALEKISWVLESSLSVLWLSNCFKLKGGQRLIFERMASTIRDESQFACIPGGNVPNCFNHRNKGHSLTISSPYWGQISEDFVQLLACIVVSSGNHLYLDYHNIRWTCKYIRGNSRISIHNYQVDIPLESQYFRLGENLQSDHLFLFKGHLKCMDNRENAYDKVELEFYFEKENGKNYSQLQVKECGVCLHFMDNLV